MEHESDNCTNCDWCFGTITKGLLKGSWWTGWDYPNDSITENGQNPEKNSSEKLSANTDVKNSIGVNNNNNNNNNNNKKKKKKKKKNNNNNNNNNNNKKFTVRTVRRPYKKLRRITDYIIKAKLAILLN